MGAVLRPSGGHAWSLCGFNYPLGNMYPEPPETDEKREGTAAHFYPTEFLQGRVHPVGALAPNGVPVDGDMIEFAQDLIGDVRSELARATPTARLMVEQFLTMHRLVHPLNEGTPDVVLIDGARKLLIVWDYKYGHRLVEAYRNPQGIDYFAGVLEAFELTPADTADWTFSLRIVQPRAFGREPIQRWDPTPAVMWEAIGWLAQRALIAVQPGSPAVTGPHCRDCDNMVHCAAAQAAGLQFVDFARHGVANELDNKALGFLLLAVDSAQKRLDALKTGLEELAAARIRGGHGVPYWGFKSVPGRTVWNVPAEEVAALGDVFGVDLRKPLAVLTPKQAQGQALDPALIAALSRTPTSVRLVKVDANAIEKAFS